MISFSCKIWFLFNFPSIYLRKRFCNQIIWWKFENPRFETTTNDIMYHCASAPLVVGNGASSKSIIDKNVNIDISYHTHQNITHLHLQPKLCIIYTNHQQSTKSLIKYIIYLSSTTSHTLINFTIQSIVPISFTGCILHKLHLSKLYYNAIAISWLGSHGNTSSWS